MSSAKPESRQLRLWADGKLRDASEPVVRASDPGFLLGLAAFETMLWERGVLYFKEEHLLRLEDSARGLGLAPAAWSPEVALAEFTAQLGAAPLAVRLTLTPGAPGAGPSLLITGSQWTPPDPTGVGAFIQPRAKLAGDPLESLKTSSRLRNALARAAAAEVGAWDALLGTEEGDLTEGSVSNLFAVLDGQLVTPPVSRGILPGIMRDKLVQSERLRVLERRLERSDLARASEVFLTNSLARIAPLRWIHELRDDLPGAEGPLTRQAAAVVEAAEARYRSQLRQP